MRMEWPQGSNHPVPRRIEKIVADEDDRIFRYTDPVEGWQHRPLRR